MKNRFPLFLLSYLLFFCGCASYTIDSRPQGLRVTVNGVEYGKTPCELTLSYFDALSSRVDVIPPSKDQIRQYEQKKQKTVLERVWHIPAREIRADTTPEGQILFNFIQQEKDALPCFGADGQKKGQGGGYRLYRIDSHPQGLRVTFGGVEHGVTPCEINMTEDFSHYVIVYPPSKQQWREYQLKNKKITSIVYTGRQEKYLSESTPSGTILFDFVSQEYDIPTTEEEKKWVEEQIKNDEEKLERENKERSERTPFQNFLHDLFSR